MHRCGQNRRARQTPGCGRTAGRKRAAGRIWLSSDMPAVTVHPLKRATGYAPLPWGIDLLLTDACNLRCTYCPITTDMNVLRPSAVMDTGKAIRFLGSVSSFRPMIRMFGGEPFLHPDWPAIFASAVGNGLPITVVTNGTRLVGRAEELVRSGLLAVGISVDPPGPNDLPNVDVGVLEQQLRQLETTTYPFRLAFHPPLPVPEMMEFYRDPEFRRHTARPCTLISSYAFVDPRGRLYPCLTLDMGNVFEQPFEDVWNGRRFRTFRRLLRREERLPLCERCPA